MIRIGYRKGLTLASAVGASLLVTAAASAKSAPRMPHGPARPVEQATVLHVQSNAVEVKVQGPGPRGQSKTLTIKSSRFSAKSPLAFSHLEVGQHIVLSSTSSGWKVSKAPTPPITGTVQKVSGTSLVIKEPGRPGHSGSTESISLANGVTVLSGPSKESLSAVSAGDQVSIQKSSQGVTIHLMPTPPLAGKVVRLSNGQVEIRSVGPGKSWHKTFTVSNVKVVSGPQQSSGHLKVGDMVGVVESSSHKVTIQLMPTPPNPKAKGTPPKPGHGPIPGPKVKS